jgi:phage tail sheath protein FI
MSLPVKSLGVRVTTTSAPTHIITGVVTSITAFVGRAPRGVTNAPIAVSSFAAFTQSFGGLWTASRLGYAVRDFFANGGTSALVVRLVHPDARAAAISLSGGALTLAAVSPGAWGDALAAVVDDQVSAAVAAQLGLTTSDLFNLTLRDATTGAIEQHQNLSVKDSARRVDTVLATASQLVRVLGALPPQPPRSNPPPGAGLTIWNDPNAHTAATPGSGADGGALVAADFISPGLEAAKGGLYALDDADLFNLLTIPPYLASGLVDVDAAVIGAAASYCEKRRAMLLIDPPSAWTSASAAIAGVAALGTTSANAAVFFPQLVEFDPLQIGAPQGFAPGGAIAGVTARTDALRGVWKAAAGTGAAFSGVEGLSLALTDAESDQLNDAAVNGLRSFSATGPVIWGARTLQGASANEQWAYVPVRRLALYIEASLDRGLQWVIFEPNGPALWSQMRDSVGAFMLGLFKQGALQGATAAEAFFVQCDAQTTTQADIDQGIVNIVVGFAPLKPAEFVTVDLQRSAGSSG